MTAVNQKALAFAETDHHRIHRPFLNPNGVNKNRSVYSSGSGKNSQPSIHKFFISVFTVLDVGQSNIAEAAPCNLSYHAVWAKMGKKSY